MVLRMLVLALAMFSAACGPDASDCDDAQFQCEVFELVNDHREANNLPKLKYDVKLADASQAHAVDMNANNYFSHTGLNGSDFSLRARNAGYTGFPSGENIAKGQTTPQEVVTGWMNSSGHRANILSNYSNEIGVGFHNNHWVQTFGKR